MRWWRSAAEKWESRADRGALLRPHLRADGVLLVEGIAVRAGVLEYSRPDGSVFRELVPEETIVDSAAGLARLPLTLQHPAGDVTPENAKELVVGDVDGQVLVADRGFTSVKLAIRRADALQAVRDGTVELSPGYQVLLDPTPGEHPEYGPYDAIQVGRRYNHLALVDLARGGRDVRLNLDGVAVGRWDAAAPVARRSTDNGGAGPQGGLVKPIVAQILAILGISGRCDNDDTALQLVAGELQRRKDAEEEAEEEEATEIDTLQKSLADAVAQVKAAKDELAKLEGEKAVAEDKADHASLSALARSLGVDPEKTPKGRDLRTAIAKARVGEATAAKYDAARVDAVVEIALHDFQNGSSEPEPGARGDGFAASRDAWAQTRTDGGQARDPRKRPPSTSELSRRGWGPQRDGQRENR